MSSNSGGLGIYEGFEGYRDPTEDEVAELLGISPVIIDTNVLLDIYGFEEPARVLALDMLEALEDRIWAPHQVVREFWRNRHGVIASIKEPAVPIETLRGELLSIVNSLRPDRERPEEIQAMRTKVETQLDDLAAAIDKARGTSLDVKKILDDTTLDPVLGRIESILEGRVGPPFDNEPDVVDKGLERFKSKVPPGYADGQDKSEELPERGTGDYLMWEQTLQHIESMNPRPAAFILVTNDSKEDWRISITSPQKRALGVRPELVAEAIERTGVRLILLQQNDFYRLMSRKQPGNESASESLVEASALSAHVPQVTGDLWTPLAHKKLLDELRESGNALQADIISLAARAGGFIPREEIYRFSGFGEDRSLRRFAMPAQRIALALVERGLLSEDAEGPLSAVYEGPGKTVGYRVPLEFSDFEKQSNGELTWVEAAAKVARIEPDRTWSVSELVNEIGKRGLRDLSTARTPEATLRRDLSLRDDTYFEAVDGGYRLLGDDPEG